MYNFYLPTQVINREKAIVLIDGDLQKKRLKIGAFNLDPKILSFVLGTVLLVIAMYLVHRRTA